MSIKVNLDSSELRRRVAEVTKNQHSKAVKAMKQVAIKVANEAVQRVPVELGGLTSSIKQEVENLPYQVTALINVPTNSPASSYAIVMHENQYNLGGESLKKQSRTNVTIGNKFITRAIDDNLGAIKDIIISELGV